jgi:hypothetical protein
MKNTFRPLLIALLMLSGPVVRAYPPQSQPEDQRPEPVEHVREHAFCLALHPPEELAECIALLTLTERVRLFEQFARLLNQPRKVRPERTRVKIAQRGRKLLLEQYLIFGMERQRNFEIAVRKTELAYGQPNSGTPQCCAAPREMEFVRAVDAFSAVETMMTYIHLWPDGPDTPALRALLVEFFESVPPPDLQTSVQTRFLKAALGRRTSASGIDIDSLLSDSLRSLRSKAATSMGASQIYEGVRAMQDRLPLTTAVMRSAVATRLRALTPSVRMR